jgi:hypothetical protein
MSSIRVENILNKLSTPQIKLNSSGIPTINNLGPNIIYRDGDNSSLPLMQLSEFNQIHVYTSVMNNALVYLRTSLVQNALYEIWNNSASGGVNIDARLFPNGTSYANEFATSYRLHEQTTSNFVKVIQTPTEFYFDQQAGGLGTRPTQHWVFSTGPTNKYVQFEGADNGPSLAIGYGRWTNNSRTWDWVGYISTSGALLPFKRCWIRRIG